MTASQPSRNQTVATSAELLAAIQDSNVRRINFRCQSTSERYGSVAG